MMKFKIKTQNGKVKNSKTLRLTGMYFTEPKYPKLIPAMQKPIAKIKKTIGKLVEYPQGRGWAKSINDDGSLLIGKEDGEIISIYESMISEVSL